MRQGTKYNDPEFCLFIQPSKYFDVNRHISELSAHKTPKLRPIGEEMALLGTGLSRSISQGGLCRERPKSYLFRFIHLIFRLLGSRNSVSNNYNHRNLRISGPMHEIFLLQTHSLII